MARTSPSTLSVTIKHLLQQQTKTVFQDLFSQEVWSSTYKDHNDVDVNDTMFRVAAAVAGMEDTDELKLEWTEKFYDLLSEFKCTAGGRIYANAGTEWGGTTLMNCFNPEVEVMTSMGPKQICDIEVGDLVLTHKGRYRPVVNTMTRQYVGPVQRFSSGFFTDDIVSTPEHPYYQGNDKWTTSENTRDVALSYYNNGKSIPITVDLAELLSIQVHQGYVEVGDTTVNTKRSYVGGQCAEGSKIGSIIKRFINVDDTFAYLLGRFVGDGCTFRNNNHPSFAVDAFNVAFNSTTESSAAMEMVQMFESVFGICPNVITSQNNTTYVRKASLIVSQALHNLVGSGFATKLIPEVIWKSNDRIQRCFLRGLYDADGFVTTSGSVHIELTNPSLINQVQSMMTMLGIPCTRTNKRLNSGATHTAVFRNQLSKVYTDDRLNFKCSKTPTVGPRPLEGEGFLITPERIDEDYAGFVYNISVEEDESYVVNNVVVHNCYVGPRDSYDIDSLDNILRNLKAQSNTLKSEGGWGENFSYIRPRGSFIHGIGVETPGAVKYMELFDKSSEIITAGSGKKSTNVKAKGKIRKGAMMGVLDCIAGNTPIHTLEGKVAIKDLVGTRPYLYCTDGHGNVLVRQALLVWSKGIKKTIKVVLDNDDFIECTPEHEFMLSDGSFKQAKDLQYSDSLCVLNKRLQNNYLTLSVTGSRKSVAEHNAVYEMKYGEYPTIMAKKRSPDSLVAHHVDHIKWNNHPDNIQQMTLRDHSIHHSDDLKRMQSARASRTKGTTWEEFYGDEKADQIKAKYVAKRKGSTPWNKGMTFAVNGTNHKVVRVEESIEQEVFDVSMPDHHNFVANGVFIHNCWHPDILEFITAKTQPGRLTKFNISVNCTDEFMLRLAKIELLEQQIQNFAESQPRELDALVSTLEELDKWDLIFPDTQHEKYKAEWNGDIKLWKSKGYTVTAYNTISVKGLWNLIMESTYNRAEPGVLFLDRANHFGPLNYAETIFATNPCGEQTLAPGNVCNLGSLNLVMFLNKTRTGFDLKKLAKYTTYLVRFLDNVNTLSNAPLPEYEDSMRHKRRIGVGILGWGSALYMLKTRFGSQKAAEFREQVMSTIAQTAYTYSVDLAEEKGMFTLCEPEKHVAGAFVQNLNLPKAVLEKMARVGIRNSSLLSIQPTGNTSIFANVVSGGLEPVFMPEYVRTVIVNTMPEHIAAVTPKWFEGEWFETEMFKLSLEGDEEILRGTDSEGTVYKIDKNRGLTKEVLCEDYGVRFMKSVGEWDVNADWAATTTNLTVEDHVRDLTGFARWVDAAMSKTVNVPNDYPFEAFKHIYTDAYKSEYVKGVTTYRSGTMTTVLAAKDEKDATASDEEIILDEVVLPDSWPATMKTLRAEGAKFYLTVVWNESQTRPFALFVQTNHREKQVLAHNAVDVLVALAQAKGIPQRHIDDTVSKMSQDTNTTKIARAISLLLRHGVLIKNITRALDTVDNAFAGSFVFHIKKFLSTFIKDGEPVEGQSCANCGSAHIIYQEGCSVCRDCGSSKCS
jgi:ribonucleoside-diphosphate reductase alpha chain